MDDTDFDDALITAAFALTAAGGWSSVSVAAAARHAALPLDRARARFPTRDAILMRFGRRADQAALADAAIDTALGGTPRENLFDIIMRRFDALQTHRAGIQALLHELPANPALAIGLGMATNTSMAWMLEGAGIKATGLLGLVRTKGLAAVWLYTLRAWDRDDSPDLSGTMAALDRALNRAEQLADMIQGGAPPPKPKPFPDDPAADPPPAGVTLQ